MVATTIAAVRGDRHGSLARMALWHLAGLIGGATVLAVAVAQLGAVLPLPRPALAGVLGALALVAGAAGLAGRSIPVASTRAQVPKAWSVTMEPAQYAFTYGLGLGVGVATRIPSWSLHLLLGILLIQGDPVAAALVGPVYGISRGLPVVVSSATARSSQDVLATLERLRGAAFKTDGWITAAIGALMVAASA